MADHWQAIEQLPTVYGRFSAGMLTANLDLLRSGVSQSRYRGLGPPAIGLLPAAEVHTRVYILTRHQDVLFVFIKGPETTDLLLQLDISFQVAAGAAIADPEVMYWQAPVWLRLPPFCTGAPPAVQQQMLAHALGEDDAGKITYLRIGTTLLGAVDTDDYRIARMARLEPGASAAVLVYTRVAGTSVDDVRIRYEPATFLALLDEVAGWVRDPLRNSALDALPLPVTTSQAAAQRLLVAVVRSWLEARRGAAPRNGHRLLQSLLPAFEVVGFHGEIVLRLRENGSLAEKPDEDTFRLRMSLEAREEAGRPRVEVSLQPPDFLVDGQLHKRLLDAMLTDQPVRRMFADSQLPSSQAARFRSWLRAAAEAAVVFRAEKRGDVDTDVFVFRSEWDGASRVAVAAAIVEVQARDDDFTVQIQDVPDSMVLLYTDLPGNHLDPTNPMLPKYLIALVHQMDNWMRALRGQPA